MDLTPPSLTNSPYSPQRKSVDSPPPFIQSTCIPETSTSPFESLTTIDNTCNVNTHSSPYGSMIDPSLTHPVDIGSPFAPLDSIPPSVAWATPDLATAPSPSASTTSSMPNVLSSEYDQFGSYESSCLSAPYPANGPYSRTASHSPAAFMRTPPPSSSDVHGRESSVFSSRNSFGFAQDPLAPKPKMNEPLAYSPMPETSQFPLPRPLAPSSHPGGRQSMGSSPQIFFNDMQNQNHEASLQSTLPSHMMTPQTTASSSLPENANRWTRVKRAKRRPTRRHTTKEEANFQCMVKGCGKFFSRSYNFKSHMETHDDKREYPFPCQVANCTKKFVRKTDLQRHHQSVHTKERNHKCDYCARLFARKDTLRR